MNVEDGIKKWCERTGVTMLAMVTHNKNFFNKTFVHIYWSCESKISPIVCLFIWGFQVPQLLKGVDQLIFKW